MLKQLIVYFLSFIVLALFASPALAQTASTSSSTTPYTLTPIPSSVSPTSPLYTDMLVHNMFHTFSCLAVGSSIIGQPCLTYQITQNAQGAIQGIPVLSQANLSGGVLGATTSLIGALYDNRPVRSIDYLASVGEGLGIVKEANAQVVGSGARILNPILTLWQVSRNISYVIMIIIFVIIGLMVMFRNRINPQTVITAQAALPGLVIGLIMITFSYFLAGLIADTAFIGTNLVGAYFSTVKEQPPENLVEKISPESVLSILSRFIAIVNPSTVGSGVDTVMSAIDKAGGLPSTIVHLAIDFIAYQFGSQVGPILAAPVATPVCIAIGTGTLGTLLAPCVAFSSLIGQTVGGAAAFAYALANPYGAVSIAVTVLIVFILIYTMLRLVMRLISNYLNIIFLVITAPFQFLFAALPGRQGFATNWVLNLLANVLAFPAVLAVFYFVAFLLRQDFDPYFKISQTNQLQNSTFLTPNVSAAGPINIVDANTFPLFGGMNLDFIRLLLAFGALMATPAIPDIINRSVGRLGQAGQLIGQEVGAAYGGGRRYTSQAGQAPGQVSRDLGQLQQLGSQTTVEVDATGTVTRRLVQPGLWKKIRG